jgi:hypothetical protein
MYRDRSRNVDGMALEADHTVARARGGTRADRLLIATCNRSRGDGTRRAANAEPRAPRAPRTPPVQPEPTRPVLAPLGVYDEPPAWASEW